MAGTRKECTPKRGVHSWEVKNVEFICGWDQKRVSTSTHGRLKMQGLYVAGTKKKVST